MWGCVARYNIYVTDKTYQRRIVTRDCPPEHPNACALYDYWNIKRGNRRFPAWTDIDLLDLWKIASCLIVKDVIDGGIDFLNRYWGTQVALRAGFDATGKTHQNIYNNQPLGPQLDAYQEVVNLRVANTVFRSSSFISGRDFIVYNSLNLPLGVSDEKVDNIISVVDYE